MIRPDLNQDIWLCHGMHPDPNEPPGHPVIYNLHVNYFTAKLQCLSHPPVVHACGRIIQIRRSFGHGHSEYDSNSENVTAVSASVPYPRDK